MGHGQVKTGQTLSHLPRFSFLLFLVRLAGFEPTTPWFVVTWALDQADAVLLGAMGLPTVRKPDGTEIAPQIDIRERFGLYASLRPCKLFPGVPTRIKADEIDMLVIRELTEGLFAGRHDSLPESDESCSDRLVVTRKTCEKLFTLAFEQARLRKRLHGTPGHVTLLDKATLGPHGEMYVQGWLRDECGRWPRHIYLSIVAGGNSGVREAIEP